MNGDLFFFISYCLNMLARDNEVKSFGNALKDLVEVSRVADERISINFFNGLLS